MEINTIDVFEKIFNNHFFGGYFSHKKKPFVVKNMPIEAHAIFGLKSKSVFILSSLVAIETLKQCFESLNKKVAVIDRYVQVPFFSKAQNQTEIDFVKGYFDFVFDKADVLLILDICLLQKMPSADVLQNKVLIVKENQKITIEKFISKLTALGIRRDETVLDCYFRVRGDIVEVFFLNNIIRVEFFDDEIESIKKIDSETLNLIEKVDEFRFYPKRIFSSQKTPEEVYSNALEKINVINSVGESVLKTEQIIDEVAVLKSSQTESVFQPYFEPFCDCKNNLLDNLCNYNIVVCDLVLAQKNIENQKKSYDFGFEQFLMSGDLASVHKDYNYSVEKISCQLLSANCIFVSALPLEKLDVDVEIFSLSVPKYVNDFMPLAKDLSLLLRNPNQKILVFCKTNENKGRLEKFLNSQNIFSKALSRFSEDGLFLLPLDYPCSFIIKEFGICVYGSLDLFKNKTQTKSSLTSVFYQPKVGEFVVHEKHGIGKCVELANLKLGQERKDYFIIEYKNGDKLYLPSEQIESLSAYVGGEPTLSKIGGQEFAKVKESVFRKAKELSFDLAKLYKERSKKVGFVYEKDSDMQLAFENGFEFEETQDQLSAINDIKADMESTKVMDRLLCGDVGFGKTEVAFRAVFKAIYSGKQVALMCPTTILSQQHYLNAQKRFAGFGVKVAVLNRFISPSYEKLVCDELENGKIDFIIGTHKLLSKNVKFKDLGLLVLDEEQRFGVAHKEKIKVLKNNIDVLSMSATPIPRTLNMSLSGIRDISIIATPPKTRHPVQTTITEYSFGLLKSAINVELERGGKVLVVLNNTHTISQFAGQIASEFPYAKVGYAHGQMGERELEDKIKDLYEGKFNIFVSTTLIENGIDIPLANTLFVLGANKMGLSALYQLRGRIGRGSRVGYAYFTYENDETLSSVALSRLEALAKYTDLGSGFKIAMRDLEIRGAGNIFGSEQSGQIAKVGYDLYLKILKKATSEVEGHDIDDRSVELSVDVPAYIDKSVVIDDEERIKLYIQIAKIKDDETFEFTYENFKKTYHLQNDAFYNLLLIAYLKNLCKKVKVCFVKLSRQIFFFECEKNSKHNMEIFMKAFSERNVRYEIKVEKNELRFVVVDRQKDVDGDLKWIVDLFKELPSIPS